MLATRVKGLCVIRANYTLSLVGSGQTTICCRGRAMDQTSRSVAQYSPSPGNEMILYFSVQLVERLRGLSPPNVKSWRASAPPALLYLHPCTLVKIS